MPTLSELLAAKNKRLESVPDKFFSDMNKVQRQLLAEVTELLSKFQKDSQGNFILNNANLRLAADVDLRLREALERSEYTEFVTEFASEFNSQIGFNEDYFRKAFPFFESSELGNQIVRQAQRNAVQLLVNVSPDSDFIYPIKQQIEQAIVNNASFQETLASLTDFVVGDDQVEGKILHYAKQIAHDTFAVGDASYAAAVADEVGAEWYRYSGTEIKTTRPFCAERDGMYFSRKEIELWGDGKRTPGFQWPQSGTWAGEMEGTNSKTIFTTRGGYNCRHSIMAVSVFGVPKEDIERAISLGYYTPSAFEKKELGLA